MKKGAFLLKWLFVKNINLSQITQKEQDKFIWQLDHLHTLSKGNQLLVYDLF